MVLAFSLPLITICGCGSFFAEKPTELQSRLIINELSKIEPVSDANAPIPEIYRKPPKIMETEKGIRLFYFARYQSVAELAKIIKEQLGNQVGQSTPVNQLIIKCASHADAQEVLEFLARVDVAPVQVRIDCMVSELFADVTMDWETTIQIDNLFGEKLVLGGKIVENVLLPAFPGAALREPAREALGLKVGFVRNEGVEGHEFKALVDMLVSRGYLKILMNPQLEIVNGQTAEIRTTDHMPLPKEVVTRDGEPFITTEYKPVVDSLSITPHVFADGYIGLETSVRIGSKSAPEGFKQFPIVTERSIDSKDNRIRQGQSLIIGGLRKSEKRSVVRGVPFLKDIPIIGILFSSKDFQERAKEILFIITPTISNYGTPNQEMVNWLGKKHAPPMPDAVREAVMKSLGVDAMRDFLSGSDSEASLNSSLSTEGDPTIDHVSALKNQGQQVSEDRESDEKEPVDSEPELSGGDEKEK
jgi:type II secretory pathway component GspD/PulD (secretin)